MLNRCSLSFFLLVLTPLSANAQQVTAEELEALAHFSEQLQLHYQSGLEISAQLDTAEEAIDLYVNGALGEGEMRRQVGDIQTTSIAALAEYERGLRDMGERPRLTDRNREKALRAYEEVVRGLVGHLLDQQKIVGRLMVVALEGDMSTYDQASADSLALTGKMIEAENVALEVSILGTGPSHPQTSLSESVIGSNLAALAAMILIEDSLRGGEARIGEAREAIELGLRRASTGTENGRRNAEAMWATMANQPAVSESDKLAKQFLYELSNAYGTAFDIEADIQIVMREFLDALIGTMNNDMASANAFIDSAAAFQEEMNRLVEARMGEQARRYRMIQEFSAAMGAAQ